MIDPKELRIGNLLYYKYQRSAPDEWVYGEANILGVYENGFQFKKITGHSSLIIGLDQFDPIPITPEWLERLGFEKVKATIPFWSINTHLLPMHWDSMSGLCIETSYDGGMASNDVEMPHIKYIHQLQNLYHSLTGQELEVKEMVK